MDSRARKDTWGTARRIVAVAISLLLAVAFVPTSGFVAQPAQASADERFDGQAAVTLVGNGGNFSKWDEAAEETVYCDQTVLYMGPSDSSIYTVPTREDYTFIGWSDSSDASEASYPFDNESRCASYKAPESDVTLYAVWKATPYATLTLDANGGIFYVWDKDEGQTREELITTQRVVQDEQGWIWKTPDRDEYRLAGWDTDKDASPESVVYGPDEWGAIPITASSDMTLYAIWKKREFTTLTLQCLGAHYTAYESIVENKTLESDANGTVVLQVELGVENEISVSPDAKYKLSMWSSTNGETYDAGYFTVCPEGPMTLTATAEEVETITFVLHANGGYFVDKWSDGTGQIVTAEQSSREFAKDQERYRIHDSESERGPLWNYDSEAHIKHKFVGFSKTETEPSATAEADYSFGEYGDISVLASDFADATEPVDLYATWQTIDCWNVTLDAGDGWFLRGSVDDAVHGAKNEIDYVEKGNQYRVEDMSWGKHVHIGWATEKGGPVVYEVSEDVVWDELPAIDIDRDITLYAVWEEGAFDLEGSETQTTPDTPTPPAADTSDSSSTSGQEKGAGAALLVGETTATSAGTFEAISATEVAYTASSSAAKVSIPATVTVGGQTYKVTSIGNRAFKGNKKVSTVTVGSNVETIGASAFQGCTKLSKVTLDKSLETIGANAFKGCVALKTVKLPANVRAVAKGAFQGCTKLSKVTLDKSLEKIGASAFRGCTSLASVTVPAHVRTIGKSAYQGCRKLKSITLKTQKLAAKTVGANAFKGTPTNATVKCGKKLTAYKKFLVKKGMSKKASFTK